MARNEEKAQSMLARFRAARKEELEGPTERRPYLATECDDVRACERWRRQILSELTKLVALIQNAGLGEFRIRDMNDDINKKLREKGHWEDRIKALGGPDYRKTGPKMLDHEGKEVPGNKGYKYFGAARDLPGVRELFEVAVDPNAGKKKRGELITHVDADYYGYRDEEDGILVALEGEAEVHAIAEAQARWEAAQAGGAAIDGNATGMDRDDGEYEEEEELYKPEETKAYAHAQAMEAHSIEDRGLTHEVPDQAEIEKMLLDKKRALLLAKYASSSLQEASDSSKEMTLLQKAI